MVKNCVGSAYRNCGNKTKNHSAVQFVEKVPFASPERGGAPKGAEG